MKINNKGFTLIELVVVLVIMSLIASIALPNVVKIQSSAKTQVDKANRQTLLNAVKIYYIDNTYDKHQNTKRDEKIRGGILWLDTHILQFLHRKRMVNFQSIFQI